MRKSFTLLEIFLVLSIVAILSGSTLWSLHRMLAEHQFQAEVDRFKKLLSELQIEAMILRSDIGIHLHYSKGEWEAIPRTEEVIIKKKRVPLKQVQEVSLNLIPKEDVHITIFSTGWIIPTGLIGLKGKTKQIWIDLRKPIQINSLEVYPKEESF